MLKLNCSAATGPEKEYLPRLIGLTDIIVPTNLDGLELEGRLSSLKLSFQQFLCLVLPKLGLVYFHRSME